MPVPAHRDPAPPQLRVFANMCAGQEQVSTVDLMSTERNAVEELGIPPMATRSHPPACRSLTIHIGILSRRRPVVIRSKPRGCTPWARVGTCVNPLAV